MKLNLPGGSLIFGDKAYHSLGFEDALQKKVALIWFQEKNRIKNAEMRRERNKIETVFSSITSRMARDIKARTENCKRDLDTIRG